MSRTSTRAASVLLGVCLLGCGSARTPPAARATPSTFDMAGTVLHGPAPDFTLTDQFGQAVALHQFRGKVVILDFVDSQCTTICPLTTQAMLESLGLLGPAAADVQLLGVDANPQATAVSDVMSYSAAHQLTHAWHFLTGSVAQLRPVWAAYHVAVQIWQGSIDHTPALYVIGPDGQERDVYLTPMEYAGVTQEANVVAGDAARLLPSHPPVLRLPAPPHLRSTSVRLPVVSGNSNSGSVMLGPGHDHLIVFLASWVPGAATNLTALNRYATDAGGDKLPALTAVDVLPTESSPAAPVSFLKGTGLLLYPVATDSTGRVADLYAVQDLAWYVLTDSHNHVRWQHDGWLSMGDLEKSVKQALQPPGG